MTDQDNKPGPTEGRQKNPYKVDDVVTVVHSNGSGEGILWKVTKVKGLMLTIQPVFTVTGPSVLHVKRMLCHCVKPADVLQLCTARMQLDNIINDIVRSLDDKRV